MAASSVLPKEGQSSMWIVGFGNGTTHWIMATTSSSCLPGGESQAELHAGGSPRLDPLHLLPPGELRQRSGRGISLRGQRRGRRVLANAVPVSSPPVIVNPSLNLSDPVEVRAAAHPLYPLS